MRALRVVAAAAALALSAIIAFAAGASAASDDGRLLDTLVAAYPDFLAGHADGQLIWKDGTRMPFDDGRGPKSFETRLNQPSLKDQFHAPYATGKQDAAPGRDVDPGRVRYEPFFVKMYGDCRSGAVQKQMEDVVWLPRKWGGTLKITRVNGIADKLRAVSAELDRLPARFDVHLKPPGGTFNCRTIAGTGRRSMHAFAAAIDIAAGPNSYWRWAKGGTTGHDKPAPHEAIPIEIVEIFERHGFIWGGKWYHFDTMHFEYRPELIAKTN